MYKIREIVNKTGESKYKIAEELGISHKMLYNYMNGTSEPTAKIIVTMCKYFKVSADYLLNIDEQ